MIRVKKEVEAGFGATIANRVADQLRDDIVSHRIKPGSRITAKEIADKYGVSSMPVREAFSMLCGENLLEMNPYRVMTPILEETLLPPRMATRGRLGLARAPPMTSSSFSIRKPDTAGRQAATPAVEAWARCTAPKASDT